jgi:hypothetical protein
MLKALTFGAVAVIALAGVTASDAQERSKSRGGRACFNVNDVRSWEEARGGRFIVRTGRGEFFEATFLGPCPQVDIAQTIVIHSRTAHRVCEGDDATVVIPGRETCRADLFRKMSAEEVAALPPRQRP